MRTSTSRLLYSTLTLLLLPARGAVAERYDYYPGAPWYLGAGIDPRTPYRAYARCIVPDKDASPSQVATNTTFDLSFVHDHSDLYQKLHVDASLSASGFWGSAGGSFSLEKEFSYSQDDVVWVLRAQAMYEPEILGTFRLTPGADAKKKLDKEFSQYCGTQYIAGLRRAVMVAAVFVAHAADKKQREEMHAHFSGASSWNNLNASFNYDQYFSFAAQSATVNVHIVAIGGKGITKLADLTDADVTSVDSVRQTMKAYLAELKPDQAVPLEIVTASWNDYLGRAPSDLDTIYERDVLKELFFSYQDLQSKMNRLGDAIRHPERYVPGTDFVPYETTYKRMTGALDSLRAAACACLRIPSTTPCGTSCHVPAIDHTNYDGSLPTSRAVGPVLVGFRWDD